MTALRLHVLSEPGPLAFDTEALRRRFPELEITVSRDRASLPAEIGAAEILLTNEKVDVSALRSYAPNLKWVQVTSAGVEAMLPTLPDNVLLTNASGVHSEKGAEFVLSSVLLLNYQIPEFMHKQARRDWAPVFVRPLRGKTAVVLGSGSIGSAAIALLAERGMTVIAVNRSGKPATGASRTITLGELDGVLPGADFLVSTLPATAGTTGAMGKAQLEMLPHGAGIVSVGRAAIFDHDALCAGLIAGHLGGAVLDVFPQEPLPADDPTWSVPRLIATPHCSVDDLEGYVDRCVEIFGRNLDLYRGGQRMETQVDPAQGY